MVYSPAVLIVPTPTGVTVHVTAVLLLLTTVAANCFVWPPYSEAVAGLTLTATVGSSVIVADPNVVESAWLIAEIVTVCCMAIPAGAV